MAEGNRSSNEARAERHRFLVALTLAAFAHGLLTMAEVSSRARVPPSASEPRLELELDLDETPFETPRSIEAPPRLPAPAETVLSRGAEMAKPSGPLRSPREVLSESVEIAPAGPATAPEPPAQRARSKNVRLFLAPSELRELTTAQDPLNEPKPTSPGLLVEGLLARDAEKGLSRSSPAISASRYAANLAPAEGTAVIEVRVDALGNVASVTVASGGEVWAKVAAEVLARLKSKKLQVPAGSRGMVARLRIDRGELALEPSERGRASRGTALGQDHHARDYGWNESTQAPGHGDRMSPTLGLSSDMLRSVIKTRVRLLSEQAL